MVVLPSAAPGCLDLDHRHDHVRPDGDGLRDLDSEFRPRQVHCHYAGHVGACADDLVYSAFPVGDGGM